MKAFGVALVSASLLIGGVSVTLAADKKGDDRKAFMSSCLKGETPAGPMTQQDKMKKCNARAKATLAPSGGGRPRPRDIVCQTRTPAAPGTPDRRRHSDR